MNRRPRQPAKPKHVETPIALSAEEIAATKALVIKQDNAVIVLNKPSGLSSQGGRIQAHTLDDLLWAFARPGHARPRLIHRLDRDTSGVILTAKTKPAAAFLGKALMAKRFRKTYLAVLAGAPQPKGGTVDAPIKRESIGREAYSRVCGLDDPEGETARTRYRTLAANDQAALVECSPETGRMHQIRVHMASLGRPLLGDVRYGGALTAGGAPVPRLMLHAAALVFPHPEGGEMRVTAPLPDDMAAVLAACGLSAPETQG
jgi:RluA family pseudouridine synthase